MRRLWMLVVIALVALAACGDDDGDGGVEAELEGELGVELGDGSGDDLDSFLSNENCSFLLAGATTNPVAAILGGGQADFEEYADQIDDIADAAPAEIRADFELLADRYGVMLEAYADIDFSDPEAMQSEEAQQAMAELGELFDEEFAAAASSISAYLSANC